MTDEKIFEQLLKLKREVDGLIKPEIPAGIDPTGHSHSKLVAADGNPDPAWSADNAGNLTNDGGGVLDLNGVADALVLDADADTSISAPTDDQIDFEAGGADRMTLTGAGLALASGARLDEFSTDGTMAGNSDVAAPTEKAVKTYVDTRASYLSLTETGLSLSNGLNSNITLGAAESLKSITGPTAAFSVGGFTNPVAGKVLILFNTVAQNMTVVNEDASSTAANRIRTNTGADVATTGVGIAMFVYLSSRWTLISIQG